MDAAPGTPLDGQPQYVVGLSHSDRTRRAQIRAFLVGAGYRVVPLGREQEPDAQVVAGTVPDGFVAPVPTLFLGPVSTPTGEQPGTAWLIDDGASDQALLFELGVLCRQGRFAAEALSAEGVSIDARKRMASTKAGSVSLTAVEYRLFRALVVCVGQVTLRRSLARSVWPEGTLVARNTLDSHIRHLRGKLASIGAPFRVETIHGRGFRLTVLAT